jgi:hypothetical protein
MYYGNENTVPAVSSGPLTFEFFDDFQESTFKSHWTTITLATWTVTGGFARHGEDSSYAFGYLVSDAGQVNGILETRIRGTSSSNNADMISILIRSEGSYIDADIIQFTLNYDAMQFQYIDHGSSKTTISPGPEFDKWYGIKIAHNNENIKVYVDTGTGYDLKVTSTTDHTTGTHIGFIGICNESYVDYIFQRKYALPDDEPVISTGGDIETYSQPTPELIEENFDGKDVTESGVIVGLPVNPSLETTFSRQMDKVSLEQAVSLKAIRNNTGIIINTPVHGNTVYFSTSNKLVFTSTSIIKGYTYELTISTDAKDSALGNLSEAFARKFSTIMDYAVDNVELTNDDKVSVSMPADSLDEDWYITIDTNVSSNVIDDAAGKAETDWGYHFLPDTICECKIYDNSGNPIASTFDNRAVISIACTSPTISVNGLSVWYLDTSRSLWTKLPSTVDTGNNRIEAETEHLSIFALMTKSANAGDDIFAYPVPWRPNADDPDRYGTESGGIIFSNLPNPSKIKIYNTAGELVKELSHTESDPAETWDGKTTSGRDAASGVYIYVVEFGSAKKFGKLMVIR